MTGISKRFGAVTALDHVDLEVARGSLHAVVGENGAGKTTLMRILYGAIAPDEGEIQVDGEARRFASSAEAIEAGIGMVSQHYGVIPALTCLQNLMLGAEHGRIINRAKALEEAHQLAQRMGFEFDWHAEASSLSPGGAQKLEILKLLWRKARIMILDEPTAMLSPLDSDSLFASMRQLAAEGSTVILVTHRLPEVMDHCSRVTVLRGGRLVGDLPVADTSPQELAKMIVGGEVLVRDDLGTPALGPVALSVKGATVRRQGGGELLSNVSIEARAGEVLGIAGVDGSGQRELFRAILGIQRLDSGTIELLGRSATKLSAEQRIELGVRIIPEDRHDEGVVESWSLDENAALGLQRLAPNARGAMVDRAGRRRAAEGIAQKFQTRYGGLDLPIASLSGGNQQRFVAARALSIEPKLILAFQPARGLDLNATAHVYRAIREEARNGAAAIVVSFDLDELLDHCDRIVAMSAGHLAAPEGGHERDRDAIGRLMVGVR